MPSPLSLTHRKRFAEFLRASMGKGSPAEILRRLSETALPAPYKARLKVVYSDPSPLTAIANLAAGSYTVHPFAPEATSFFIRPLEGQRGTTTGDIPFTVVPFDGIDSKVQAVLTVSNTPQWTAIKRELRFAYPRLVPVLLSQAELVTSAKALRRETDHDVRVRSFTAKEEIATPEGKARRSVREWTDEELDGALLHVSDRRQLITSIDLEFFPRFDNVTHVVPKATCKIRKYGEVEVTGSLSLAYNTVAREVAQVGFSKLQFYSGRGLREAHYRPHPLAINYSKPLFNDVEIVRSLVATLSRYPRSMHAVQHGNPYAHLRVTDLFDYSSFDVWALPPGRLVLVPGLRASEAACERLVHYIFDYFREGDIANYERGSTTS